MNCGQLLGCAEAEALACNTTLNQSLDGTPIYEDRIIGTLSREQKGRRPAANAAEALQSVVDEVTGGHGHHRPLALCRPIARRRRRPICGETRALHLDGEIHLA
jgi:hypothetical protein